jgi:hypothetical protein
LRKKLRDLHVLSNTTTSRLDNTYYSVLEKVSTLQHSVAALKELAIATKQVGIEFNQEAGGIINEATTQIKGFDSFNLQKEQIEALESRLKAGQDQVQKLVDRVKAVKTRAEDWSRIEGLWQEKTRRRIRWFWGFAATVLLILLGIVIFQYTPARTLGSGVSKGLPADANETGHEFHKSLLNETLNLKRKTRSELEGMRKEVDNEPKENPRLKVFDEL